jgi:hypothetical protein
MPGYFPAPIAGGGTQTGAYAWFAGVATFSTVVTQVGLTAGKNGEQYLTVWNTSGVMLGQVSWVPNNDASFVGIDSLGVPIGMVAYGNHDLWNGQAYDIGGPTIMNDSWIWATGSAAACTSNAQCNDGNPCTDDACNGMGFCVHTNNTAPCDDKNACTQVDLCMGGVCVGMSPVACSALDQCHGVGFCDPTSGICSNPTKPDGTACTSNNLCAQTHTCMAGVCTGSNPVMCAPPDQCHTLGMCDMTTGMCVNPAKPDGAPCDDGNACTQSDVCAGGTCVGGNPVTCTAMDACHDVGVCSPMTGKCTNPTKMDGTMCDDGNACTQTDICLAGVCTGLTPLSCPAMDACHALGACDPKAGCVNPAFPDGTPCPGGTCVAGVCKPQEAGTGGAAAGTGASVGAGGGGGGGSFALPGHGACGCRTVGSPPRVSLAYALLALLALRGRRLRRGSAT